jgi:hypothetical protein
MMEGAMNDIFTHFPYMYQDGHWISTAADDRREQLVQGVKIAAKVALGMLVTWMFFVVFLCM